MTNRQAEYWVIPPEADAEFVAGMEEVLDVYQQPFAADHPVICMDEQPVQLIGETRQPIPATKNHPKRVDYENKRNGTATVFMFCEPLGGWREATVREQKTKVDWAQEVARLLELGGRYAECEQVTLVCDNLNTHTRGAFYEAFEPERARQLARRIRFYCTPKHGSWLNVAKNELSCLTEQCVKGRRIGTITKLRSEVAAWSDATNTKQRGVDWQFQVDDARVKLKSLYPKIKL